jgi:hypothetical protein
MDAMGEDREEHAHEIDEPSSLMASMLLEQSASVMDGVVFPTTRRLWM